MAFTGPDLPLISMGRGGGGGGGGAGGTEAKLSRKNDPLMSLA